MRFFLLLLILASSCVHREGAPPAPTLCFGDTAAKRTVVYLHGMDIPEKSAQERQNREKVLRIAMQIGARVAIPRATRFCPGSTTQLCWGWKLDDSELNEIRRSIRKAAADCGAPPAPLVIGFSNGGYALNKLYEKCMMEPDQKLISIGAGNRPHKLDVQKLNQCGRLILIVGAQDHYNNRGLQLFIEGLRSRGGDVRHVNFQGRHEIPESDLLQVLQSE